MSDPQFDLFICTSREAISRFLAGIAEEKSGATTEIAGPNENGLYTILYHGLVFEGWVPPTDAWPENWIDSHAERIFCEVSTDSPKCNSAFALRPGPHISIGRPVPVIFEKMLELASKIGANLNYTAVFWRPAQLITGAQYFDESISQMASGGILPVLSLIDFRSINCNSHQTFGLAHFSGQEICLQTPEGMTENDRLRRLVRLALDAILHGPVIGTVTAEGISPGERVSMELGTGSTRVLARTYFEPGEPLN